jgi:hypothetical protein
MDISIVYTKKAAGGDRRQPFLSVLRISSRRGQLRNYLWGGIGSVYAGFVALRYAEGVDTRILGCF